MRLTVTSTFAIALTAAACGPKAAPAPVDNSGVAGDGMVESWNGEVVMGEGEMLFTDDTGQAVDNPHRWQPEGGPVIGLIMVVPKVEPADRDHGTVRAVIGAEPMDIGDFAFNPAYGTFAEWIERPGGQILFRGGDGGGSSDPGSVQLYLLGWDAAEQELRVVESWSGDGIEDPPTWAK